MDLNAYSRDIPSYLFFFQENLVLLKDIALTLHDEGENTTHYVVICDLVHLQFKMIRYNPSKKFLSESSFKKKCSEFSLSFSLISRNWFLRCQFYNLKNNILHADIFFFQEELESIELLRNISLLGQNIATQLYEVIFYCIIGNTCNNCIISILLEKHSYLGIWIDTHMRIHTTAYQI